MTDECEITARQIVVFGLINDIVTREGWNALMTGWYFDRGCTSLAIVKRYFFRTCTLAPLYEKTFQFEASIEMNESKNMIYLIWYWVCCPHGVSNLRASHSFIVCVVSVSKKSHNSARFQKCLLFSCNSSCALPLCTFSFNNFACHVYFSRTAIVSPKNSNETKKRCPNIRPFSAKKNVIPLYLPIKAGDVRNAIHFVAQKPTEQWIVCGAREMTLSRKNNGFCHCQMHGQLPQSLARPKSTVFLYKIAVLQAST